MFENLLGAINFQNFWGVCNVGDSQRWSFFLFRPGFRTCRPLVPFMADRSHTLKFRLVETKQVVANRGVRFDRYGNSTGVFLCYFNGIGPVLPICGIKSVSPLPIPVKFLP